MTETLKVRQSENDTRGEGCAPVGEERVAAGLIHGAAVFFGCGSVALNHAFGNHFTIAGRSSGQHQIHTVEICGGSTRSQCDLLSDDGRHVGVKGQRHGFQIPLFLIAQPKDRGTEKREEGVDCAIVEIAAAADLIAGLIEHPDLLIHIS